MEKIEQYTRANQLSLNSEKTQIILFTKDKKYKEEFKITLNGKEVKHQSEVVILGNILSESLTWETHIRKRLIPALRNRVRTLRMVKKIHGPNIQKNLFQLSF